MNDSQKPLYCASCGELFAADDPRLYAPTPDGVVNHDECEGTACCGPILQRDGVLWPGLARARAANR